MTQPINLKNYKIAKEFIEDGALILKLVNLSMPGLNKFTKYKPVANMLSDINSQKAILEAHMRTAKKIVGEAKSGETKE